MAKTGTINGTTSNQYIDAKIEYSYTQDVVANESTVTATLYYRRTNSYNGTTSGAGTFVITIDGTSTTKSNMMNIGTSWVAAVSAKETISHKTDGTKTITISASGGIPSTTLTSSSCSDTVTLSTIPRASTITSATDKKLGSACAVKWTPLSKSFRYKLKFTLSNWSYTTPDPIHPNTTSAYTYTDYTLPLTVANQLPNDKIGTMKVVLTTYSDSEAKTQVGSSSSEEFTVTVPDNESTKPVVTMTLAPVHSLGTAFNSVYVQGKSKVQATLSAEGKYSASVSSSSYSMEALGKTDKSSPYQSDYLSDSGLVTIKGYATDSRGYTGSTPKDINVIPYSKPQIIPVSGESAIVCARCDSSGNLSEQGTSLKIKAKRSYSTVKDSANKQLNFCLIRYRYKLESAASYSSWVTILDRSSVSSDEVKTNALLTGQLSLTNTYMVQVGVIDDIGETNTVTIIIPTEKVYMDRDGKNNALGIGKYAEDPNTLDIAEDWNVHVRGGLEVGGSSSVTSLKLGVKIPATATTPINLNDYKTPGNYYSAGADVSANITNSPYTEGGFGLVVRELQSTNYIGQEMHYARTRWVRHWNGSEWSEWTRNLITDTESGVCTDFVVEQGKSGIWSYRKWASGHAECWGSTSVTRTLSSAWGSLYVCSPTSAIAYPFTFVERPTENATIRTSSPACWLYSDSGGKGLNTATQTGIYAAVRPTQVTTECTLYIDFIVKGRWK